MSSITAQQTKLDMELVLKEKRLDIGKYNGRLNPGKIQRELTFQVVLDALALTPCYQPFSSLQIFKIDKRKRFKLNLEVFRDIFKICPRVQGQDFDALPTDEEIVSFLRDLGHTREIHSLNDVVIDQMHQPWRTFAALINRIYLEKQLVLTIFVSPENKSFGRNKIGIHTSKDDYLINTARFVSAKEETQIYGAILPESLTSPKMKETKANKTYLGFASGATPPKKARKFKKSASPKLTTVSASTEEPTRKSKRVKRPTKKTTKALTRGGNNEDDSNNEQESSGEDSDQKNDIDDDKNQLDNENESNSEHETDENESGSEYDQDDNEEDEDDEEEVKDELLYDDADIRLNEQVDTDKEFVQEEGTDAAMTNIQQGNGNPKIIQVIEDAHVTLSTFPQKTEVLVTSSSHSSDLADKFLNFLDIPHTDAEIVSPMDVHVHHEVPSQQTPTLLTVPISVIFNSSPVFSTVIPQSLPSFTPPPQQSPSTPPPTTESINPPSTLPDFASIFQFNNRVTALEKEVAELKKDPMHTQVTALVDIYRDTRLGETREEFLNFLSVSLTARITEQVKNQLPHILPKEAAATITEFELKKILIDKIDKSESYLAGPEHRECYEGLKKSYDLDMTIFSTYGKVYSFKRSRKDKDKDEDPSARSDRGKFVQSEEPEFKVTDSDMPRDQEENLGKDDEEPKEKVESKRYWFTKPTEPQEPTNPDWNVDKTPQQGQNQSWLMTLASSADKPSKTFDELMSIPIDFSAFIMNGLKINNLT
ncbi:hypothetical protein Tco_0127207 [Tanacetum coccineum]